MALAWNGTQGRLVGGTGNRHGKATPELCLASAKWHTRNRILRMLRSGSGEQARRGMIGRRSGLASCTGEAMESLKTESKRWSYSKMLRATKYQRHGGR